MQIHIIPDYKEAERWCEIAERYDAAFEYNDFFKPQMLNNPDEYRRAIDVYKSLNRDRSRDTLHGAFLDICVNSTDSEIKSTSIARMRQSLDTADELGCRAVIFHTNYITGFKSTSYRESWVKENAQVYKMLLKEYPRLCIFVENMFDDTPELLRKLAVELKNEERFGVCFDIAHANLWELPIEEWIEQLGCFIKHIHANDNYGDEDSHFTIGEGNVPWKVLNSRKIYANSPSLLIEITGESRIDRSYRFLKEHCYYPFNRNKKISMELTDDLKRILNMGINLTAEKNFEKLLDLILSEAMDITNCDAGTLYILEKDRLSFKILRNNSMNVYRGRDGDDVGLPPVALDEQYVCAFCAINKKTINITDVYSDASFDWHGPREYDKLTGYHTQSMLVVPLINHEDVCIGVLQLMNVLDENCNICPFDSDSEYVTFSLASQAAISLSNMLMMKELRDLLYSFVESMTTAIDARTPYNANHTKHVAQYCDEFVSYLQGLYRENRTDYFFSDNDREQLVMAAMLHDVGKLITPLEIMNKADRLAQYLPVMEMRWKYIEELIHSSYLLKRLSDEEYEQMTEELKANVEYILKCNTAGFLSDEDFERIDSISRLSYSQSDGTEIRFISEDEVHELKIHKCTLTVEQRKTIEDHVVFTDRILSKINFGDKYNKVSGYAGSHHEFLNGTGYPKHITSDEIPVAVRILTIMDVYDSLSSNDRPYRKQTTPEDAFRILDLMVKDGQLDRELVDLARKFFTK